jgi:serine/threonine-protein kinase RsbW
MQTPMTEIPAIADGFGATPDGARAVRLTIPAKAEYITLGRLALTGLSRLRPFSDELVADLKLALTEACSNSVRHAYAGQEGSVEILYELHEDRLVIEVADQGDGFEPEPSSGEGGELSEGGLGIAIIRAIADELEIGRRADGTGSRLRLVKLLAE